MDLKNFQPVICVVGLGYVGLPLAYEFARQDAKVYGLDVNKEKITSLKQNIDLCNEVSQEELAKVSIEYSDDPAIIKKANFIIVAVPTPIDDNNKPDLNLIKKASKTVGENLQAGSIVVFESTVYPGVTEDICLPILEDNSSLKGGKDFYIGYSPERVNPGDKEHTIDKIVKIVAGMNEETLKIIAQVYSIICKAGVYQAPNIKTAEAAKVIENIQRDLNIALVNELSLIFNRMGINTKEVLAAAGTKWNFHQYNPGLVGGHCIGVDPYYLTFRAQQLGYEPQVILAGRRINNYMAEYIVKELIKLMTQENKKIKGAKVLIMGLTFKENVNDIRNSKAQDIIKFLKDHKIKIIGYEPLVGKEAVKRIFGIDNVEFAEIKDIDAAILFNKHKAFKSITLKDLKNKFKDNPILFDIKNFFNKQELDSLGFVYKTL